VPWLQAYLNLGKENDLFFALINSYLEKIVRLRISCHEIPLASIKSTQQWSSILEVRLPLIFKSLGDPTCHQRHSL